MTPGYYAYPDPNPCLRCGGDLTCGSVRGCCPICYERYRKQVEMKAVSWAELEAEKKVLPRSYQTCEGHTNATFTVSTTSG